MIERRIRVLVADDSALMRKMIPEILRRDPEIEVAGIAIPRLGIPRLPPGVESAYSRLLE